MWTTSRPHHYQIDVLHLRPRHDLLANVLSRYNDGTPARPSDIRWVEIFQHQGPQFLLLGAGTIRAVKQNQFGVVRTR
jgi:hypothetical protein